jgi:hypothetical protein
MLVLQETDSSGLRGGGLSRGLAAAAGYHHSNAVGFSLITSIAASMKQESPAVPPTLSASAISYRLQNLSSGENISQGSNPHG